MMENSFVAELAKSSPLQRSLISTAWESLSVESKVCLIESIAHASFAIIPEFLSDLALADAVPIVRVWGAKFTYFKRKMKPWTGHGKPSGDALRLFEVSEGQLRRSRQADEDTSELVRAAALYRGQSELRKLPQLARLLKLRYAEETLSTELAHFLRDSIAQGQPNIEDLRDCLFEYFASDACREQFNELHADGYGEHLKGQGMNALWALAATAPLEIALPIAAHATLQAVRASGFVSYKLDDEYANALPDDVKAVVVRRDGEVSEKLRDQIRRDPHSASATLKDAVNSYDKIITDHGIGDDSEHRKQAVFAAPDRGRAILELVWRLEQEIVKIRDQLSEPKSKRGFFR